MDKETIRAKILQTGAVEAGFARAEPIDPALATRLDRWYADGCHATMEYMPRHADLRRDPRSLLPSARTVVSAAFPYYPPQLRDPHLPQIALYAYGRDYHKVLVKLLRPVCRFLSEEYGAATRICVDSAPIAERYWALKCGIGRRGDNGTIITDTAGSYILLAEILTDLEVDPDTPSTEECSHCGACRRVCPGKAIADDATIDARRCLSYLTIEHRGPLNSLQQKILDTPEGRNTLFGCDLCQKICPHNRHVTATEISALHPDPEFLTLDAEKIAAMTPDAWSAFTAGRPLRRSPRLK